MNTKEAFRVWSAKMGAEGNPNENGTSSREKSAPENAKQCSSRQCMEPTTNARASCIVLAVCRLWNTTAGRRSRACVRWSRCVRVVALLHFSRHLFVTWRQRNVPEGSTHQVHRRHPCLLATYRPCHRRGCSGPSCQTRHW